MQFSKHAQYVNKNGDEVPSVTTVLKILNKPAISKWANFMGFKRIRIKDVLEKSSVIGTTVHQAIECFLMKKYLIFIPSIYIDKPLLMMYMDKFISWYKAHEIKPIFMERKFISNEYGGTVDFYGEVDGKKTILDFKTSKNIYSSMFLQLGAYCKMLEENNLEVQQVGIVIVNDNKCYSKFLTREELTPYIETFNLLLPLFHKWYNLNKKEGWGDILE